MTREEKILNIIKENRLEQQTLKEISFSLSLNEEPLPYARERHTRFGGKNGKGRFYNKRASYMNRIHKLLEKQIDESITQQIDKIIANKETKKYYVDIVGRFYIKIPKSDSMKTAALKEMQIIRPTVVRGDVDNYMKLFLDVLHDIVYDDDSHVIKIQSEKYYSLYPRVELDITIRYEV